MRFALCTAGCMIKNVLLFLVTDGILAGEACTIVVTDPEGLLCHSDLVCDKCLAEDGLTCQIPLKGKS